MSFAIVAVIALILALVFGAAGRKKGKDSPASGIFLLLAVFAAVFALLKLIQM